MKLLIVLLLVALPNLAFSQKKNLILVAPPGVSRFPAVKEYLDFVSSALSDAGYTATFQTAPLKRAFELALKEEVDGVLYDDHRIDTKTNSLISVSFPIIYGRSRVVSLRSNKDFDENHLEKYKGAYLLNNTIIENEIQRRKLNCKPIGSVEQNIQLLISARVDYIIALEGVARGLMTLFNAERKIKISDQLFIKVPIYFTLSNKHKKDLPQIEAAFRKHLQGNLSKYPMIGTLLNTTAK